ncbi:MAG: hypothetical protein LUC37_02140 [Prevotella sp.]|nr:hypothetical protein [Prevotella sp.]
MECLRTTAGWKDSFAYKKLIQLLVQQVIEPDKAMVIGGTWRVPLMEHLFDKSTITDLKVDATYSEASFSREYESCWCGDFDNSFFSSEQFDRAREIVYSEDSYKAVRGKSNKGYYVLGVDVGRLGCTTEVTVFKVLPQENKNISFRKVLVNLYTLEEEHFEKQAIFIKQIFFKFKAKAVALDGTGLGVGLIDFLVKDQINPDIDSDQDILPNFGVINDEAGVYKQYRTAETVDALYVIKFNAPVNSECYSYIKAQMNGNRIKFLIDDRSAQSKLLDTKEGQEMSLDERSDYLRPYVLTNILKEQMMNLIDSNEGGSSGNIVLKQSTRTIKKDKFSSMMCAMYYVRNEENARRGKAHKNIGKLMFFN